MYDNGTHICVDRTVSLEQPHVLRSSGANVQTTPNSGRNCTFPWWMDTPIWSRPAGAISTKAVTLKPLWKIISGNLAAIPAPSWRIGSTRPAAIKCSALSSASNCPARPLGRRKASETDTKIKRQIYRDACKRSAIEGRNGKTPIRT